MNTPTTATIRQPRLREAERIILARLGDTPWTLDGLTDERIAEAKRVWSELRAAVGFRSLPTGWVTTSSTSPKLAKSDLPTIGVTLLSDTGAAVVWSSLAPAVQATMAAAVGATVAEVAQALGVTVCPCATDGCINGCVTSKSANATVERSQLARVARNVLTMMRPDLAICLLAVELRKLQAKHPAGCRWRVNVSDDLRWELLAPGLFDLGVPGYAYTKHSPAQRPGRDGLSVVYSAHEAMSVERIASYLAAGHRVAVVLDIPKGTMVTEWNGMPVVNGDLTDDLYTHPAGHIVGLSLKAPTLELKEEIRQCGFAKPPTSQPVTIKLKTKQPARSEATTEKEVIAEAA